MNKTLKILDKIISTILILLVAFLAVGVTVTIVLRYFFGISFAALEDFLTMSFIFTTLFGSALAIRERQHISISFLADRIAGKSRAGKVISTILIDASILFVGTCNFGDDIFDNTMPTMRAFGKRMIEKGIKPEYECFEMGHLDTILTMARKGEVPGAPMQFNFVLGVPGCTPATVDNLCWLVNKIPAGSTWTATGIGRHAFTLAAPAIVMGGNVRVGFEDNLYLERGVLAKSNGELVDKVVRMAKLLGRQVATSDEAREILSLKKR